MFRTTSKLRYPNDYHLLFPQEQRESDLDIKEEFDFAEVFPTHHASSPAVSTLQDDTDDFLVDFKEETASEYSSSVGFSYPSNDYREFLVPLVNDMWANSSPVTVPTSLSPSMLHQPLNQRNSHSLEEYETNLINLQIMMEKRNRRKKSHNLVEKRRREYINEKIQELGTILPEEMLKDLIVGNSSKPNKGAILRKSVDHIKDLQQQVHEYKQYLLVLEKQLADLSL